MSDKTHDATFYVQVEPEWGYRPPNGEQPNLRSIKAVSITQKSPLGRQKSGTIVTKLTLRFPDAAFIPLRPEAVIEIPASMTHPNPIEIVVEDPEAL